MSHPFRVREIAAQAGLSQATVDRVLHGRNGVRDSTVRQVEQAIADLERQQTQLQLGGRTFMVDVVMQTPERFSLAVRAALEAALPALRPAMTDGVSCPRIITASQTSLMMHSPRPVKGVS